MGLGALRRRIRAWARRHIFSFFSSLGALVKHRVGTLMTVTVLGIAILLPLGLWVTLDNLGRLDLQRDQWGAVTVFLAADVSEDAAHELAGRLRERDEAGSVSLVSPEQGMDEFIAASGFADSMEILGENPLPWVLMVSPDTTGGDAGTGSMQARVDALMTFLQSEALVESVQYDHKWLQRLGYLLELGRAGAWVLSLLFGVAVIVVVANTIRLDVAARVEEIEIFALVGARNGFIRQPFLYSGLWYGLMGGVLALVLMQLALFYIEGPLGRLLETYGHGFELHGIDAAGACVLLAGSGLLGLLGAWVSVQRYLRMLAVGGSLGRR